MQKLKNFWIKSVAWYNGLTDNWKRFFQVLCAIVGGFIAGKLW